MSFWWSVSPVTAFPSLADEQDRLVREALYTLCQAYQPQIEAWMKTNAPWQDQTGNARQTLWSEVEWLIWGGIQITFSHGMDYGIFLELAHGGSWAVVGPALDHFAPLIWADIVAMMS